MVKRPSPRILEGTDKIGGATATVPRGKNWSWMTSALKGEKIPTVESDMALSAHPPTLPDRLEKDIPISELEGRSHTL
ncbi:hypothetical protein QQP08_006452 [Theobroma cacao]|uniref:Uncharacterized protein n=1 Tax=Theobroma cacao TaxID=3641 RepID=A0A061EAL2_THECC|nr:Uncharacterized protein TCM_011753 [Theobroma cacao]WRX13965.1 hypothetical protein QQP08_006452 [Theobroma cacao]